MDTLTTTRLGSFDDMDEDDMLDEDMTNAGADRSLVDDVRKLADEARALAEAEAAYQKARAAFVGAEVKWIAIGGVLAVVLGFFALMALTMGLLLALTPLLTAWGATAVVVGLLLIVGAFCTVTAARRWSRMTATLAENGGTP